MTDETNSIHQVESALMELRKDETEIIDQVKWMLAYQHKSGDVFKETEFTDKVDGFMRGTILERVSAELEIGACKTIFPIDGDDRFSELEIKTLQEITNKNSKEDVLRWAVQKSIREVPLQNLTETVDKKQAPAQQRIEAEKMVEEVRLGYAGSGKGENAGIFYGESVIPDAALIRDREIIGLVEVKAYLPEEMEQLVEALQRPENRSKTHIDKLPVTVNGTEKKLNLGADLYKETEFIDNFRAAGFGLPELYNQMPVLLRFPENIPDETLVAYGKIIENSGIKNIIIQKIPFTTEQLSEMAKQMLNDNMDKIDTQDNRIRYSKREIAALKRFVDYQEEMKA